MKKLLELADAYCHRQMDWTDVASLKFCMGALGVLLGLATPRRLRGRVARGAAVLFFTTYVPLMTRFLTFALHRTQAQRR